MPTKDVPEEINIYSFVISFFFTIFHEKFTEIMSFFIYMIFLFGNMIAVKSISGMNVVMLCGSIQ